MPVNFSPSKNAAHRLACLALYRALLKQCAEFVPRAVADGTTTKKSSSSTLKAFVEYRFRRDKKLRNWQQIRDALQFGRRTLQLFQDAAADSAKALEEMSCILSAGAAFVIRQKEILEAIKIEQAQQRLPKKFAERKRKYTFLADKSNHVRQPNTIPVLRRPAPYKQALKDKDGRRKVPTFFVCQAIPFLRYTRRQPLSLGRQINSQVAEHEKLWTVTEESKQMIQMAEFEDEWDRLVWKNHKIHQPDLMNFYGDGAKMWSDAYRALWNDSQAKIKQLDKRRLDHGEKLFKVYLAEEKLARIENWQRQRKKTASSKNLSAEGLTEEM